MRYQIMPHIHHRNLDGEVIILDGHGDKYLGLNKTGTVIWQSLTDGGSREDAVANLVSRYGIAPDRAAADVDRLVSQLVRSGLLQAVQ
jgi:predicted Rdx family selenoprotein